MDDCRARAAWARPAPLHLLRDAGSPVGSRPGPAIAAGGRGVHDRGCQAGGADQGGERFDAAAAVHHPHRDACHFSRVVMCLVPVVRYPDCDRSSVGAMPFASHIWCLLCGDLPVSFHNVRGLVLHTALGRSGVSVSLTRWCGTASDRQSRLSAYMDRRVNLPRFLVLLLREGAHGW